VSRLLRRLADFFDKQKLRNYTREVNYIALFIFFSGIISAGVFVHGKYFLFWIILFALFFSFCAALLFRSSAWSFSRRSLLLAFLLLLSIDAISQYVVALFFFSVLLYILLRAFLDANYPTLKSELTSSLAVILLCFSAYGIFADTIEWVRNSALKEKNVVALKCINEKEERICNAENSTFSVPEFWSKSSGSSLSRDISRIIPLQTFIDTATKNIIAFAAIKSTPEKVTPTLQNYFSTQKSFLESRATDNNPLVLRVVVKSVTSILFAVNYERLLRPSYLGTRENSSALILLHSAKGVLWLFIIDGKNLENREFLLHRIVTGLH